MIEEKKQKLHGFAGIVAKQVEPLNENQEFKSRFKDKEVKVLLNAKDGKWAALLVIDKGTIHIEGIKNEPKKNIKKKVAGWDGLISCNTETFLELLTSDNISMGKVVRKVISGKIKLRGIKHVLVLLQLFEL